jgi:hypothetical protein
MLNTKTVIDMAGRDLPQKYTPVAFCLGVRLERATIIEMV